jgi:hypothetical protein
MPKTDISILKRIPGIGAATIGAFHEAGYRAWKTWRASPGRP